MKSTPKTLEELLDYVNKDFDLHAKANTLLASEIMILKSRIVELEGKCLESKIPFVSSKGEH